MSFLTFSRRHFLTLFAASTVSVVAASVGSTSSAVAVTGERQRCLEVKALSGTVTLQSRGQIPLKAWSGARLERVDDVFETGLNATAMLQVDTGIGQIYVAENSKFRVKALLLTEQGGRVTELEVLKGQVRLSLRPFTNPESRFALYMAAGVTEVTGTEFGVSVQPDGKMGVATESGSVEVTAEGESVTVEDQMQTLVIPGQSPRPASPLLDDPELQMNRAEFLDGNLKLSGQTDPVNLLSVDDVSQLLGPSGEFDLVIPVTGKMSINLLVTTPLGKQRRYEIPLSLEREPGLIVIPEERVDETLLKQPSVQP